MADSPLSQQENLRKAIAALDAQRAVLGDAVVETALAPLRAQLAALESEPTTTPTRQTHREAAPLEERRLITILFSDIVGSTSLAEKLDPEEWRAIVGQLHSRAGDIIAQHHGQVAQYLGDGLLALFGAQASSEADAENAIRAALDIQNLRFQISDLKFGNPKATSELDIRNQKSEITLRIGIHTGLVVVGELGAEAHKEFTATGDAMNLAARLQSAAPPGGIIISEDTYRYVRGVFEVTPQPPLTVKGKSEPIKTYVVSRAKPRPFRSVSRGVAGVQTRTIGREKELKELEDAYFEAFENKRMVWAQVIGEPGVGKSRLLAELDDWIDLRPETKWVMRARAFPGDAAQPFSLIRRLWFDRFQIAEDEPLSQAEAKWVEKFEEIVGETWFLEQKEFEDDENKINAGLEARSRFLEEAAQALGLLVGLPFEDSPYIGALRNDPAQVRGRAFVVSRQLFETLRVKFPITLLLEDLHWADTSSLEYLLELVVGQAQARAELDPTKLLNGLFAVATARPEWNSPEILQAIESAKRATGIEHARYIEIGLEPLAGAESLALAYELLQGVEGVPDQAVGLIVRRAEGIPYYAEELVSLLIDRGIIDTSSIPWRFVGTELDESQLPQTLQHLLLTRLLALPLPERACLQRGSIFGRHFWEGGLRALNVSDPAGLLGPLAPRGFVQPEADSTLASETEWSFHHALLRDVTYESVLKRERPVLHKAVGEWLEHQAQEADRLDEFAGLLGEHAERAGKTRNAAGWFLRAGSRAKAQGATREARNFFDRALALLPPADEMRWSALVSREEVLSILSEADAWRADVDALVQLADEQGDDGRRAEAYYRRANYARMTGDYDAAVKNADFALAAAGRAGIPAMEVKAVSLQAQAETRLGQVTRAQQDADRALGRARAVNEPELLALVLYRAAFCFTGAGDIGKAAQLETEMIAIEHRLGNRHQEAVGLGNLGNDYLSLGLYPQARTSIEQSLQLAEAIGARRVRAYDLLYLGGAQWLSGDYPAARRILQGALKEMTAAADIFGQALALDAMGYLMEAEGDAAAAGEQFARARDHAAQNNLTATVNEALAGMARSAWAQGDSDLAWEYANRVWEHLREQGAAGLDYPMRVYETCATIFEARGERALARAAVNAGYGELMGMADKISDPKWRESFLTNVRDHRVMVEMWQRSNL